MQVNYTIIKNEMIQGAADPERRGAIMTDENYIDILTDKENNGKIDNSSFSYIPMFGGLFNIGKQSGGGYVFNLPLEDAEQSTTENAKKIIMLIDLVTDLIPYIKDELSNPKYKALFFHKVLTKLQYETTQEGKYRLTALDADTPEGRAISAALDAQKQAQKQARAADAREIQRAKLGQAQTRNTIRYKTGNTLITTNTKLANEFFSSLASPIMEVDGQLQFTTIYAKNKGIEIPVCTSYSYNEKFLSQNGITRHKFEAIDYFISMVLNNLYSEGNREISFTKLWHELGNTKSPNPRQLEELREAVLLGMSTIIDINNRELLEFYGIDTEDYIDIQSPVLPIRIKTERSKVNGNITNATIAIDYYSPFILVADPLGQISTWDKRILKLYPGSRTARYWRVMRYLMREIGWMRNSSKRSNIIKATSLCEAVGDKTRADKQRTLKLTYELLEKAFMPLDYVSSFVEDKNGNIALTYNKERKPRLNADNGKNQN